MLAPTEWLKNLQVSEEVSLKVRTHCFEMIGRHAAECVKWTRALAEDMEREEAKFMQLVDEAKGKDRYPQSLPTVVNYRTRTESFLDHVQTCLLETSKLIDMLVLSVPCARNYTNILQFLRSKLQADDPLIAIIDASKDVLKRIATLRNAARHDAGLDGKLTVFNYTRKPGDHSGFVPPVWKLNDEPPEALKESSIAMAEFVIAFSEQLLIACLCRHPSTIPVRWEPIPPEKRDPVMPYAFELQGQLGNRWIRFC